MVDGGRPPRVEGLEIDISRLYCPISQSISGLLSITERSDIPNEEPFVHVDLSEDVLLQSAYLRHSYQFSSDVYPDFFELGNTSDSGNALVSRQHGHEDIHELGLDRLEMAPPSHLILGELIGHNWTGSLPVNNEHAPGLGFLVDMFLSKPSAPLANVILPMVGDCIDEVNGGGPDSKLQAKLCRFYGCSEYANMERPHCRALPSLSRHFVFFVRQLLEYSMILGLPIELYRVCVSQFVKVSDCDSLPRACQKRDLGRFMMEVFAQSQIDGGVGLKPEMGF